MFPGGFCSKTIIPDSEEHPLASSRAVPKDVLRWIRVNQERHGGNGDVWVTDGHGGNGDVWVTDGYGEYYVHRYDKDGNYLTSLSGEEGSAGRFSNPHGVWIDTRKPESELYISDRRNQQVQVYDTEGNFKRAFGSDFLNQRSPSGFITHGDQMMIVELRVRLTVVDADDRLVTYLGDNSQVIEVEGWPNPPAEHFQPGKFIGPHGMAADSDGNLYITELVTGGRLTKLAKM